MRNKLKSQYPGRPLSERIDDWVFSAIVVMAPVILWNIAYYVGQMAVERVASK